MSISAEKVKSLREKTGSGMMDCKKVLVEANGDEDKAVILLRERGLAKAAKKAGRATGQGVIGSYIHSTGKIGVLIELKCETDFVAKNEKFRAFAKDLAMQVAAANPLCLAPEDVPQEILDRERAIYKKQVLDEGKPENIAEKIVEGRIKKYYKEACLLEQPFIKDDKKCIRELVAELVAVLGENIQVGRFMRMNLGEEVSAG